MNNPFAGSQTHEQWQRKQEKMIAASFKKHKATLQMFVTPSAITHSMSSFYTKDQRIQPDPIQHLQWKEPGTGIGAIDYYIRGQSLFIAGDYGFSSYRWSQPINFEFLSGCDIGYFSQKCMAKDACWHDEWESKLALGTLKWYYEAGDIDFEFAAKHHGMTKEELLKDMVSSCQDRHEWNRFLTMYGAELFSEEYYRHGDIGETIPVRTLYHLVGLKTAMAQIGRKKIKRKIDKILKMPPPTPAQADAEYAAATAIPISEAEINKIVDTVTGTRSADQKENTDKTFSLIEKLAENQDHEP